MTPTRTRRFPILVTGAHRSGTTFVGRMLSLPVSVGYVIEPFSRKFGLREIDRWFLYVTEGMPEEPRYRALIEGLLRGEATYKRPPSPPPGEGHSIRQALRSLLPSRPHRSYLRAVSHPLVARYLIKDPIAALSSEYLHRVFSMDVVVVIRHPAAFVASVMRAQEIRWGRFDLKELHDQDSLMRDHLRPVLAGRSTTELTPIESAALLWKCINLVLTRYLASNPSMIGIRHEDVSADPLTQFKLLYEKLGLRFTRRIASRIDAFTSRTNPTDPSQDRIQSLRRDSRGSVRRWKALLSEQEVAKIRDLTEEVSCRYYGPDDW